MATVSEIFSAAMALMDELGSTGTARTADTLEYEYRAPAIVNSMTAEYRVLCSDGSVWTPAASMDDEVNGADAEYALGAMIWGLAAGLLVDENPSAAGFYQQRYEELRNIYVSRREASTDFITDLYGGIGLGGDAQW